MVLYTAIAFFVRPEPNTDDLTNVNKFLWNVHCALGPGRFTSETFLDVFVLVGLINVDDGGGSSCGRATQGYSAAGAGIGLGGGSGVFDPSQPIAPLDPNRFALSSANSVTEEADKTASGSSVRQRPAYKKAATVVVEDDEPCARASQHGAFRCTHAPYELGTTLYVQSPVA